MSKPLQIAMLGFVNLKARGNLSVSNTLQPLFPISLILILVVIEFIVCSRDCNALIPTFPEKVVRIQGNSENRYSAEYGWE